MHKQHILKIHFMPAIQRSSDGSSIIFPLLGVLLLSTSLCCYTPAIRNLHKTQFWLANATKYASYCRLNNE